MDYQCPPCRKLAPQMEAFLASKPNEFRLSVHHLPLKMHERAYDAAVTAESVALQGGFAKVHHRLLKSGLDNHTLQKIASEVVSGSIGLAKNQNKAQQNINADLQLAKALGIDSTPTFLLCYPDGSVYRVSDLAKIPSARGGRP